MVQLAQLQSITLNSTTNDNNRLSLLHNRKQPQNVSVHAKATEKIRFEWQIHPVTKVHGFVVPILVVAMCSPFNYK